MSFERALQMARDDVAEAPNVPTFARIDAAMRWTESAASASRPERTHRWLATAGALLAALTMATDAVISVTIDAPLLLALALPIVLLGLSAVWIHRERIGSQLAARAIWWSYLLLGVVWATGPVEALPAAGSLLAVGCGLGVLAAGRKGLTRAGTTLAFDPIAFRGTLLLSMILGLADAQLLGLVGVLYAEAGALDGHPAVLLSCAALLLVGTWGLLRLRVWAVVLNLVVNVLVVALVAVVIGRDTLLLAVLGSSAALQLVLPIRLLIAFRRGAGPRDRHTELPALVSTIVVGILVAAAVVLGILGTHAAS